MLAEHPNLHIDISWTVVAERLTAEAESSDRWKSLINDFPDRFLFGSDALAPKDKASWNATYEKYKPLLNDLELECQEKVCNSNYRRVFVDARKRVREFENTRLPKIMEKLQENFEVGLRVQSSLPAYIDSPLPDSSANTASTASTSTARQVEYS
jgi:hypothetical protein